MKKRKKSPMLKVGFNLSGTLEPVDWVEVQIIIRNHIEQKGIQLIYQPPLLITQNERSQTIIDLLKAGF